MEKKILGLVMVGLVLSGGNALAMFGYGAGLVATNESYQIPGAATAQKERRWDNFWGLLGSTINKDTGTELLGQNSQGNEMTYVLPGGKIVHISPVDSETTGLRRNLDTAIPYVTQHREKASEIVARQASSHGMKYYTVVRLEIDPLGNPINDAFLRSVTSALFGIGYRREHDKQSGDVLYIRNVFYNLEKPELYLDIVILGANSDAVKQALADLQKQIGLFKELHETHPLPFVPKDLTPNKTFEELFKTS